MEQQTRLNVPAQTHAGGWMGLAIRMVAGALLVFAGGLKAGVPEEFAVVIEAYRLVSTETALVLAALLPWAELLVGWALLLGFQTRLAAAAGVVLFLTFSAALATVLARGISLQDCGCFGMGFYPPPAATMILDLLLMAGLIFVAKRGDRRMSLDSWIGDARHCAAIRRETR